MTLLLFAAFFLTCVFALAAAQLGSAPNWSRPFSRAQALAAIALGSGMWGGALFMRASESSGADAVVFTALGLLLSLLSLILWSLID